MWSSIGSWIASLMFLWAMLEKYFPSDLGDIFEKYSHKLLLLFNPYIEITFHEYSGDSFERAKSYTSIQHYLSPDAARRARRLKADSVEEESENFILSMDDFEEIKDEYQGIDVWWSSGMTKAKNRYGRHMDKRYYILTFHNKYRDLIIDSYLSYVIREGKEIAVKNRQRKLYTNGENTTWSHVVFEHPARFETLALDSETKNDIIDDLISFSEEKEYYAKIGKGWKRGYLLYGPPGTGKSTMIAAMANLLQYDVYDLELTSVKDNTELRSLLIDTDPKSIIVIEDIDCSLNLTGKRKKEEKKDKKAELSKVTLSGLLNFVDGIWSACGGERIFVFTTNHVENLDPALIRSGRMDKHIELSYCSFEAFKVLAKNYLDIESHELFGTIAKLLQETNMTPADVAENLTRKSGKIDGGRCLNRLISALEKAKEVGEGKIEEEEKLKAVEKDERKTAERIKEKVAQESDTDTDTDNEE